MTIELFCSYLIFNLLSIPMFIELYNYPYTVWIIFHAAIPLFGYILVNILVKNNQLFINDDDPFEKKILK